MCSIVGLYKLRPVSLVNFSFIENSFDQMKHRGPDNEEYVEVDDICSLGHQRLSIIDVGRDGNQPMVDNENFFVFNGELYNYRELKIELQNHKNVSFKSESDTEVFLKGLTHEGLSFLNKTNGMFSFALYNKESNRLVLGRDRFGVKPLYYMFQENVLYFSSEIKPLIKIKKELVRNDSVYQNFFKYTATDYNHETFIENIFQVKKGHFLIVENENYQEQQWYFKNDFLFDSSIFKFEDKTRQFVEDLLADAIDIRMRSDVPICLTLSGGIDSTTIYTLIKERFNREISLFTFSHPNSSTDEYTIVDRLVKEYGDKLYIIDAGEVNTFDEVKKDLSLVEFPIWGVSTRAYSEVYKAIKQRGIKVVIEGHGSDEQLAGYPYMVKSAFYDYLKSLNFTKAYEILQLSNQTANPEFDRLSNTLLEFIKGGVKLLVRKKGIRFFQENIEWTFNFKILPIVLRAFDRLSMGASIESRSPFMDYRLVEVFKKLPLQYKINKIGNKAILREILKKYNKSYIFENKKKMGFSSDLVKFFNDSQNKAVAKEYIEKFNLNDFLKERDAAMEIIQKDVIEWKDTFDLSKVILVSMINEFYGIS